MSVYRGDEGWQNVKFRFDRDFKDDTETPKELQSVLATYKEVYQEPWEFDHVEYWYETTFFVFDGNPYSDKESMEYQHWDRYSGTRDGGCLTFEDMMIKVARKVKRHFGSYDKERDFLTDAEKKNHKEQSMFLKNQKGRSIFKRNPEYLRVNNAIINLRWLEWFMTTDYCQKHYDWKMKEFAKLVKQLDTRMPKSRRKLVEKYS